MDTLCQSFWPVCGHLQVCEERSILARIAADPHGGCLAGTQGVDTEDEGQGAFVHGQGLGDLEEPDQFEAVQALGAGLVGVVRAARVSLRRAETQRVSSWSWLPPAIWRP